ncbi:MAG TPA: DUF1343 domain-containing protein [Lentisphaeria bacterium]|nr:DUF1343 domain-containing protein [Lentisphaeria bacterium]
MKILGLVIMLQVSMFSTFAGDFALGVDVFLRGYTQLVQGKKVGLITNQTGKNAAGQTTIDLLYAHPDVNLVALFSPEHGIRGVVEAGEHVDDGKDSGTGLPIHSLYGGSHRPDAKVLAQLDVLIYDIQDVGSRAYTYIWTLAEALAAAGEQHKTVIVLDRPNPLAGGVIDGPVTHDGWDSFLGLYPIPRVYGTTPGEIGRYFNAVHKLNCRLIVIPMAGYRRSMTYDQTGLNWIGPSPNIPSVNSAICFAATGTIGTLGNMNIGIGTRYPFQLVGAPWLDAQKSAEILNKANLPGIKFLPTEFTMPTGPWKGEVTRAIFLGVSDVRKFLPSTTEYVVLDHLQRYYPSRFKWNPEKFRAFDVAMGTDRVRKWLMAEQAPRTMLKAWTRNQRLYRGAIDTYRIYQD